MKKYTPIAVFTKRINFMYFFKIFFVKAQILGFRGYAQIGLEASVFVIQPHGSPWVPTGSPWVPTGSPWVPMGSRLP